MALSGKETLLDKFVVEYVFRGDRTALTRIDSAVDKTKAKLDDLAKPFTIIGTVGVAATGLVTKLAVDWESAFTGVRKTVNATEEEFARLNQDLRQMAKDDVPLAVEKLAALAEAGGQLGIENANLLKFVETIAKLGTTTNLESEQGAQSLARFANITQMSQTDFDRLGSTVVDLGNNFATTEAEIVHMGLRLAGAGDLIGLTEPQILSFATGLSSVGIEAEAGGTAFSRVFVKDKAIGKTRQSRRAAGR